MGQPRPLPQDQLSADRPAKQPCDDAEAFRVLFGAHYRIVLSFALRRTATCDDAHDATADTFTVAWRHRARLPDDRDGQVVWLLACARRCLANRHRADRRQRALHRRLRDHETGSSPDQVQQTADALAVRTALAGLSPTDQEILRLTAWEGLSHRQIGEVLELTPSAVAVRLHRARTHLADTLREPARGDS